MSSSVLLRSLRVLGRGTLPKSWILPAITSGSASTRLLSSTTTSSGTVDKLGLGGHKWSRMDPERYALVVQTALDQGIRLLEAGQEGGDEALAQVLASVQLPDDDKVTVTTRLGYRTLHKDGSKTTADDDESSHLTRRYEGDVTVETQTTDDGDSDVEIVHNLSPTYLNDVALCKSPLVQQQQQNSSNISVVAMIHNPEVQLNYEHDNPHEALYAKLAEAFEGMERAVSENQIASYGIVSNGLSLPDTHPLHLPYQVVLQAAHDVGSNLRLIQLPANVMEPHGMEVARNIYSTLNTDYPDWSTTVEIACMRPLTWYPEQGTDRSGFPVNLVDYALPQGNNQDVVFTNDMEGPPLEYQAALNRALSHFDGTALLEKKQHSDLTTEERETLEGCKLLQSILHDLDVQLDKMTSFAAYENELYQKVILTLYGHFEELDEESSQVLQDFFAAHGQAVRYAVATKTRGLLKNEDIPKNVKLQEFALGQVLREPAFSKVIVGCTHPAQVVQTVAIAQHVDQKQDSE